ALSLHDALPICHCERSIGEHDEQEAEEVGEHDEYTQGDDGDHVSCSRRELQLTVHHDQPEHPQGESYSEGDHCLNGFANRGDAMAAWNCSDGVRRGGRWGAAYRDVIDEAVGSSATPPPASFTA